MREKSSSVLTSLSRRARSDDDLDLARCSRESGPCASCEELLDRTQHERERRAELVAHVGEEAGLELVQSREFLVRDAELLIGALDLLRADVHLRLHLVCARALLLDHPALLGALLSQAHELGHVLGAVEEVRDAPALVEDRAVRRAVVPLGEAPALRFGHANGVSLYRHGVGHPRHEHALEGGPQVPRARGIRIVRIVRENIEEPAAHGRLARDQPRPQERVTRGDDGEARVEDEVTLRRGLEERTKVGHSWRGSRTSAVPILALVVGPVVAAVARSALARPGISWSRGVSSLGGVPCARGTNIAHGADDSTLLQDPFQPRSMEQGENSTRA